MSAQDQTSFKKHFDACYAKTDEGYFGLGQIAKSYTVGSTIDFLSKVGYISVGGHVELHRKWPRFILGAQYTDTLSRHMTSAQFNAGITTQLQHQSQGLKLASSYLQLRRTHLPHADPRTTLDTLKASQLHVDENHVFTDFVASANILGISTVLSNNPIQALLMEHVGRKINAETSKEETNQESRGSSSQESNSQENSTHGTAKRCGSHT
jgi:hypothetical protein